MKRLVLVPDLYVVAPYVHAVCVEEILYTSAIGALDRAGAILFPGDIARQAEAIYVGLDRILNIAGASWSNIVKVSHFFEPPLPDPAELEAVRMVAGRHLALGQVAGTEVCLGAALSGSRLQVELIAHLGVERRVLQTSGAPAAPGRNWAAGVKVGRHVYLSGHRAVASAAAVAVSPLTCETHAVYSSFDALLKDAGVAWRDLVRVRQFVTDPAADFNHVREGRIQYVPPGAFTSTSICCDPGDPSGRPARPWLIAAELEAAVGTKISLNTSALVQTPATAHALKVGNLVHLQAEISDDETGRILFKDDIEAQARHVLQKMDLLLAAAERRWDDIVTSRVFCKISEHLKRVREIERFWAGDASYARCDAVSKFFDPDVLVEVELTVAR